MKHLNVIAVATLAAAACGTSLVVLETESGSDLEPFGGVLPAEALASAGIGGSATIAFDGDVAAVLAYTDVERRLSLVPGAAVSLVRPDGSVSTARRRADVVVHDFGARADLPLAA
jgi:hypothetical protein